MEEKGSIHNILARSYLSYFVFSMLGLFADTFIGVDVHIRYANTIAILCFALGAALIVWAQYTSGKKAQQQNDMCARPYFRCGPYRIVRNPTHFGIVILVAGYTAVSGSICFLAVTLVGYIISNVFFKKYESLLHTAYGEEYEAYKKKVPKIF